MLTRFLKMQLVIFSILTVAALVGLSLIYLQLPTYLGVGMYRLYADLPNSAGLYKTANVTYQGITIGKVLAVEPTETGARVKMDIDDKYKIPVDAVANVHSVSAVGRASAVPSTTTSRRILVTLPKAPYVLTRWSVLNEKFIICRRPRRFRTGQ